MAEEVTYPDMIEKLPDIDLNLPGVRGKLFQAADMQAVFFDLEPIGEVPPHSHGDQWGVILEGEVDLIIDGVTHSLKKGDTYFIPAGAEHSVNVKTRAKALDVFAEPDRYGARK